MAYPQTKKFVKNFFRNHLLRKRYPFFGSIEMTRRCNQRCYFCPIGNEKAELVKGEMKTAEVKKVFDAFAKLDIIAVSYLGGEPTLRKDLLEIAAHARERKILSQLTTNGMTLGDRADDYTGALDVIVVSLDTTDPEKYRRIRSVDSFDRVVGGIREAVALGRSAGRRERRAAILTNTVVCADNVREVPGVLKFADSLGVDGMMVDFATFHSDWRGRVRENSHYEPDAADWRGDIRAVRRMVKSVVAMRREYPVITSRTYLETFLDPDPSYRCYPHLFCCVNRFGAVAMPCWDHPETRFLDILNEHDLKKLWLDKKTVRQRKKLETCTLCYMHCIVEPSKVLGAPFSNLRDLYEWVRTFRRAGGRRRNGREPVRVPAGAPARAGTG